jgi:hypothetical protein
MRNEYKQLQLTSQKRMAEVKDYICQTAGVLKRIKPDNCDMTCIQKEISDALELMNHLTVLIGFDQTQFYTMPATIEMDISPPKRQKSRE